MILERGSYTRQPNLAVMKKAVFLLFVALLISAQTNAQFWKLRRIEAGGGLGMTQFYGDIGGFSRGDNMLGMKDFTFKQTRINMSLYGKYRILQNVTARVNFAFGNMHATDARGSNEGRAYESKISFMEPSIIGEYYYLRNRSENSFQLMKGQSVPFTDIFTVMDCYVFAGFGGVSYNITPNAALAPKVSKTSGFSPIIPLGAGANFTYSKSLNFGVELGGRFTFTDELEGYTSVNSDKNDMYFFFNVNCIYKIKLGDRSNPSF